MYMMQGHITEEEEPPDVGADIIIISVHEERSAEAWSRLIRKCLKVRRAWAFRNHSTSVHGKQESALHNVWSISSSDSMRG